MHTSIPHHCFFTLAATLAAGVLFSAPSKTAAQSAPPRFSVSIPASARPAPTTGRLIVVLAKSATPEPRYTISPRGAAMMAMDLEQLRPGTVVTFSDTAVAFPRPFAQLPKGEYYAQAVVNVYEQVKRADGKTPWLPMNDGRIEFFTQHAGNLYSDVQKVTIGDGGTVSLSADKVVPETPMRESTEWLKRVSIRSEMLSRFWGRPIHVHATVLLPKGYAEHPDVRYPAFYALGHGNGPFGFNPTPPRADAPTPRFDVRRGQRINPVSGVETGHDFYKAWVSDTFPRMVAITLAQQTPYFADSYSVNSANNGPYGDAIVEEIIPALEKQFRLIAQPYARHLEGASTSGWQSLSLQLKYPDFFGGAWVLQPDPIDFRHYLLGDIYKDTSAFVVPTGPFTAQERVFQRTVEGQPVMSVRELSLFEEVLGSRGRGGYQLGAWEAIYGPVDADGYPKPLWNKRTGSIDRSVATYMNENGYDLRAFAEREWAKIGPKVCRKLHFFSGDMDDYHLNLAVYKFEEFLRNSSNPHCPGDFTYGRPTKGHSWHAHTWAEMVRMVADTVTASAPRGEDTKRWKY